MSKEIIIGLTGGIGVNFDKVTECLKKELSPQDVEFEEIKLSSFIKAASTKIYEGKEIKRINTLMNKISGLRKKSKKKSLMALLAVLHIYEKRKENDSDKYKVYILNSLKRPEESDLIRHIYGRNFILISAHTPKDTRIENILKKDHKNTTDKRDEKVNIIHKLIDKDFKESLEYGQKVSGTYPNAHFFVDTENKLKDSIERFVDILFDYPYHTPTIDERNMFAAKGISLRSADLSRQVGAAICDSSGNIIATGCNDVPKFGGGLYEPDDPNDQRDFQLGKDTNLEEKIEIIRDLFEKLETMKEVVKKDRNIKDLYLKLDNLDSKITDLLEFGRPIHAELAAICDAARRGISLIGATLYCTTFPCHLCIKHILAVGIKRIVYIDPYPKSKAELHFKESVTHSKNEANNKILLDSFIGISPRRFIHVFKHDKGRKIDKTNIKEKRRSDKSPYLSSKSPINYFLREIAIMNKTLEFSQEIKNKINFPDSNIKNDFNLLKDNFDEFEKWSNEYWEETIK